MTAYQSFYVSAVAEHDGNGTCEQIAEHDMEYWKASGAKIFWSVYGSLSPSTESGIRLSNCISDHDTRDEAEEIASLLNDGLASR